MLTLNKDFIKQIINETLPSFQLVCAETNNLGFGFIFYGIIRSLRPKNVVVIGSKAGFAPIMFAIGVKDNEGFGISNIECYATELISKEKGKVYFIDPSYSVDRDDKNHYYGIGTWDNNENVKNLWLKYGIEEHITHYKMTSKEFYSNPNCPELIDIAYIDGDHSYEGIKYDILSIASKMKKDGIILAHDVDPKISTLVPEAGGFEVFADLSSDIFEKFRLPIFPGLAIIRKK